jgi:hypothetical protein
MCGRFTFQPTEAFYRRFNIANRLNGLVARYNIAPSQLVQSSPQHPLHPCGMKPTLLGPAVNLSASWFVYAMRLEVCS